MTTHREATARTDEPTPISAEEAIRAIVLSEGRIFGCTFVRRTDGELRRGVFRIGWTVSVGRAGGEASYDFTSKGLIPVYRMAGDLSSAPGRRRCIPIEGIREVRLGGRRYVVRNEEELGGEAEAA